MDESKATLIVIGMVITGILLITLLISIAIYKNNQLRILNFEKTIENLTEEQKCLHICGFQFRNVFENYKFCIEKCDRISERMANECGGKNK